MSRRKLAVAASTTTAGPWKIAADSPANSIASSIVSTSRKPSKPMVIASRKFIVPGPAPRSAG